ncbi:uncharacterized protein G2W53_021882 [Senna tora]|uniref:Uncharacterized protein n=1 Tax=Senna tora TaxID=362788 RepID=A0A834TK92_9FABA|nr:uncharacterized protein G2W53_021882 [Senna tora]
MQKQEMQREEDGLAWRRSKECRCGNGVGNRQGNKDPRVRSRREEDTESPTCSESVILAGGDSFCAQYVCEGVSVNVILAVNEE